MVENTIKSHLQKVPRASLQPDSGFPMTEHFLFDKKASLGKSRQLRQPGSTDRQSLTLGKTDDFDQFLNYSEEKYAGVMLSTVAGLESCD